VAVKAGEIIFNLCAMGDSPLRLFPDTVN
jgi:hypothetical protein